MVVRVVRCRVAVGDGFLLERWAHSAVFGDGRPAGLVHATVGRQDWGSRAEFLIVTEWSDIADVYSWVGGRDLLMAAPMLDGLSERVEVLDVSHYLGVEPAPIALIPFDLAPA